MRLLAVDTTGEGLTLALGDGSLVRRARRAGRFGNDERLFPALKSLLKRAGWKLGDLDAVVAANGPGRFTAVRVGMIFGDMLSRCLSVPVVAVSRLEAFAFRLGTAEDRSDGLYDVVLPAFREELYFQRFRKKKGAVTPAGRPVWLRPEELEGAFRCGGRKATVCRASDGKPLSAADLLGPAREILRSGGRRLFQPLYLKPANFQKVR